MPDDGKLLRTVGRINLMYGMYSDATLGAASQTEVKKTAGTVNNATQNYKIQFAQPINRLVEALRIAPSMAQVAIYRFTSLAAEKMNSPTSPATGDRARAFESTVHALYKYFGYPENLMDLPSTDPYWARLDKIQKAYQRTLKGLLGAYDLYLFESRNAGDVKALGFVRHDKVEEANHPIRQFFGDAPDPNGHIKWSERMATRPIHLHMDGLRAAKEKTEVQKVNAVSRLLLHEATHKWAFTVDIKYKWETVASKNRFGRWEDPNAAKAAAEHKKRLQGLSQPMLQRENRVKPLLPMHAAGISPDQWVLNADSYAYAAYRLWKAENCVLLDEED